MLIVSMVLKTKQLKKDQQNEDFKFLLLLIECHLFHLYKGPFGKWCLYNFQSLIVVPSSRSFHLRYLCEARPAKLHGPGDVQVQDVYLSRSAQPNLQRDVCLPGGPVPVVGHHAHSLRLQQAQHEAQGDDRLDLTGPQQLWRGGAHPLDADERVQRTAGLPLAQSLGVLREGWDSKETKSLVIGAGGGQQSAHRGQKMSKVNWDRALPQMRRQRTEKLGIRKGDQNLMSLQSKLFG